MYCSKYILRKLKQNYDVFVQENIREEIIRDSFLFCFPWEEKAKLGVIVWRNMLKYTFRQTPPNQCNFVTRGQFWPSGIVVACVCLSVCVSVCVCVRQPRACPRHKSRRVQARTTKFGQKVQNNLVKVPIVLGGDWPSRSNLTWKAKFTPFWACPRHNS